MDNLAAALIVVVLAYFLWQCKCKSTKQGMTDQGAILEASGDRYYPSYRIRCPGDGQFGNTIQTTLPVDTYSGRDPSQYGFMFRIQNDGVTRKVYGSPNAAANAYCKNTSRILNDI